MTAPAPRTIADLDVSVEVLEARLRDGRRAEYAHLLCDADDDAETKPFPYLVKSPRTAVVAPCWCGHPRDRHWTAERMALGAGCHDCPGWDSAHGYGRELPWTPEGQVAR